MIKISRPQKSPATLKSNKVKRAKRKIRNMINNGVIPSSKHFPSHWGAKDVRKKLWIMQDKKCCYCERTRDLNRESDIEHFRPKTEIKGIPKPGYWWLAYRWSNLLFSCRYCNQVYKKTHFPIASTGIRATSPTHNLNQEMQILIDPCTEDPEDFISYDWGSAYGILVYVNGKDAAGRGAKTIAILGLDRDKLSDDCVNLLPILKGVVRKMEAGKYLGNTTIIDDAISDIKFQTSPSMSYLGFRRAYFRAFGLGIHL